MIEKEISENYYFIPADYNERGRRKTDDMTFRDVIKEFERDFHKCHTTEYALNLYANSQTMNLLARSQMEKYSGSIFVYGIDSAFMTFDKCGYPIIDEDSDIYPLTLLIDDTMRNGTIRLAVPTLDDSDDEMTPITVDTPKYVYA